MNKTQHIKERFAMIYRFFMRTRRRKIIIAGFLLLVLSAGIYFASFDPTPFKTQHFSTIFYDRQGKPLRNAFSTDETYSQFSPLSEISPHFIRAIVLAEDRRFYNHNGVVLSSLFRALFQNVKGQRVVSGGSTITMQTAKMVYRHRKRNIFNKIAEIFSALKIEMHMGKEEILETYINRLPFGNMIYGVKQAAQFYFSKEPSQLSLNQAIYLALIPKSPSRYNPLRHLSTLKKRWRVILERFKQNRHITADEFQRAQGEGISFTMAQYPFLAPHFIRMVHQQYPLGQLPQNVFTSLDYTIQTELEGIIRSHLQRLDRYLVSSASAIVIDNRSHQVMGFVGSADYFNRQADGNVNLATALRQPGSTLKPFVYGLALESGYTAASILPDIRFPARGGFFPKNHDGKEHGPLRLRIALACSYNIPAFYLAMKLTPARVIRKLYEAGFSSIRSESGFYGETIALGSGEVRLLDLVTAYSAFANKGIVYSPVFRKDQPVRSKYLMDEHTAFLVWDILADASARFASFGYDSSMKLPFPVAVKTGTSKGFRDKWAIGVNKGFTIGVWMGNPDGKNMRDTSQLGSASTILRDIFLAVQKEWTEGSIEMPGGIIKETICPLSGLLVSQYCRDSVEEYFHPDSPPEVRCSWHYPGKNNIIVRYPELYKKWALKNNPGSLLAIETEQERRISFPQQGDFFYLSDAISRTDQQITFEVMGFDAGQEIDYYLDNKLYQRKVFPGFPVWQLEKGDHRLTIKIGNTFIDSLSFIVR